LKRILYKNKRQRGQFWGFSSAMAMHCTA